MPPHPSLSLNRSLRRLVSSLVLAAGAAGAVAAPVEVQFAHLHNPYFPDIPPAQARADSGSTYVLAPPPARHLGIVGDTLAIPFTIVSAEAQSVRIGVQVLDQGKTLASLPALRGGPLGLYRALDVGVEGNSNGSCSCEVGALPQQLEVGKPPTCVPASQAEEARTPKGCPAADERRRAQEVIVRRAPFSIKDALQPLADPGAPIALAPGTELFLLDLAIPTEWARKDLRLSVSVTPAAGGPSRSVSIALRVTGLELRNFPFLDLSYWISEDPRDLVARPAGAALNAAWGGEWWSPEHWARVTQVAKLQASLGVTNTLVPLFVRNPAGVNSRPLVPVRCISGGKLDLKNLAANPAEFNRTVAGWAFEFDYAGFQRWVKVFRDAGFRRFEGAHLLANAGRLPSVMECDVYAAPDERQPYARGFRFLPRKLSAEEPEASQLQRQDIYRDRFLPPFLRGLGRQLDQLALGGRYFQHVIDENESNDEAIQAYARGAETVRRHLPGVLTIDAINKYSAPQYGPWVDLPVVHQILIYDDQDRRKGIRQEIEQAFPRPKYFYNTALRAGGPNRFLDTNPLEGRAQGWLALETGYAGILYWASNMYRYPTGADLSATGRSGDWSPYSRSLGPRPGGVVDPAYGAGANWVLYPSADGLIGSLRARRLRDGLLDHWLYHQAWARCEGPKRDGCRDRLLGLRARLTRDGRSIADFAHNPRDYDEAREVMMSILEP